MPKNICLGTTETKKTKYLCEVYQLLYSRLIIVLFPGCCGSEDTTSWGMIIGTVFFSIVYNISRFFEFRVKWITEELPFSNLTNSFDPGAYNLTENHYLVNKTYNMVEQTDLRSDPRYIQYYILVTNFIFMGIIPSLIMVIFNVLVVRAVNEANKRRARMTRRQQRNITVTSMLVRHFCDFQTLWSQSPCFPETFLIGLLDYFR